MENTVKMMLVPFERNYEYLNFILKTCLKLFERKLINKDMNIRIGNDFIKNTSVLDYITDVNKDLPHYKDFKKVIENFTKKPEIEKFDNLYTNISPVQIKTNNKKKVNWIQ